MFGYSWKLNMLADWIDLHYPKDQNPEVQAELRELPAYIDELRSQLAAACAALDKLREIVPEDSNYLWCWHCKKKTLNTYDAGYWCAECQRGITEADSLQALRAILYPKEAGDD